MRVEAHSKRMIVTVKQRGRRPNTQQLIADTVNNFLTSDLVWTLFNFAGQNRQRPDLDRILTSSSTKPRKARTVEDFEAVAEWYTSAILRALSSLSPRQRQLVQMKCLDGSRTPIIKEKMRLSEDKYRQLKLEAMHNFADKFKQQQIELKLDPIIDLVAMAQQPIE